MKGVGESAVESVLAARQKIGRFSSLLQFCEEVDLRACNKKVLEALIKSGSFDFIGVSRKALFDQLDSTADSAQRTKDEKERGQNSLFGMFAAAAPQVSDRCAATLQQAPEWPEDERLRYEKETLGFYITGHPLNQFNDELKLFANATTDTLYKFIDETVNIGGIVSQIKKSKIKKGRNEGKMMAKFFLDDQAGSVEVVVFSDLYSKYARWLDNGVAVLVTAMVKDTGGQVGGRSASLQSAEQSAQHIDDEYGGHPETRAHLRVRAAPRGCGRRPRSEGDRARKVRRPHEQLRRCSAAPTRSVAADEPMRSTTRSTRSPTSRPARDELRRARRRVPRVADHARALRAGDRAARRHPRQEGERDRARSRRIRA